MTRQLGLLRPATPEEVAFDDALDDLVRGDSAAFDRLDALDPTLRAAVEEIFGLAALSDFSLDDGDHADPGPLPSIASVVHPVEQSAPPIPFPMPPAAFPPAANGRRFRWARTAVLLIAATLAVLVLGTTVLDAVRDARRDPEPVMLPAVGSSPDPTLPSQNGESPVGRRLLEVPPGTRPVSAAAGEDFGYGGMAAVEDSVYRLVKTAAFTGVEAIDAATETVLWRLQASWRPAGIVAGANGVVFVAEDGGLVSLDPRTGVEAWVVSFAAPVASMALQDADLQDKVLYVWDDSGTMTALYAANGSAQWGATTADPVVTRPDREATLLPGATPVIGNEVVVMVDSGGTVRGFDRKSGEIRWSSPGFDGFETRMVISGYRLLVVSRTAPGFDGSTDLAATGIDLAFGNVDWILGVRGPLLPPVASEGTFFYLIADALTLFPGGDPVTLKYADYADCCAEWLMPANGVPPIGDARLDVGGVSVFGIDTASGTAIWSRSSKADAFTDLGTIYPQSGGLFAVTANGQMVWLQRETGGILEPPVDRGETVVDTVRLQGDRVADVFVAVDGTFVATRRATSQG